MKTLLIDDLREAQLIEKNYGHPVTNIARNFSDGINALKQMGQLDVLFLDHDLASFTEEGDELTGYMVMVFLEENPELLPKKIIPVTANPVGRAKIQAVIDKLYKSNF